MGKRTREAAVSAAATSKSKPILIEPELASKRRRTGQALEAQNEDGFQADDIGTKAEEKARRKAARKTAKQLETTQSSAQHGSVSQVVNGTPDSMAVAKESSTELVPVIESDGNVRKMRKKKRGELEGQDTHRSGPTPTTASVNSSNYADLHGGSGSSSITPYIEDTALSSLPQSDIDSFLQRHFIAINDPRSTAYRPILGFKYLSNHQALSIVFGDFKSPSPIQAAAWPFLLAGRDAVGVAETGSGKTLAFGLPCVRHVARKSRVKHIQSSPEALILSPTRELALQIYEQLAKLATVSRVSVQCVYGGVPKDAQRNSLNHVNIVVATPGRLNDFVEEGSLDLSRVSYLVLDEADRMLDKGFEDDIRRIVATTPTQDRQTCMFTATWPTSVRELAATFTTDPVRITIGDNPTGELRANAKITQKVEVVDPRGKETRLLELLKQYQSGVNKNDRILVFCLYKKEATRIENFIRMKGFRVAGIHGDMSQPQRTASLELFKSGKTPLLVATDVAARGLGTCPVENLFLIRADFWWLDIPSVKVVLNVTFPLTVEDYVHRIGRWAVPPNLLYLS